MLFAFSNVSSASVCSSINWRSFGQIDCSKKNLGKYYNFLINYSPGARDIIILRKERKRMIKALCKEGASKVIEIDGSDRYITVC